MKTGNGPLELGIEGVSLNGEISQDSLQELVRRTLEYSPLGKIFSLRHVNLIKVPKDLIPIGRQIAAGNLRVKKNLDVVAVVSVDSENLYFKNQKLGGILPLSPIIYWVIDAF